MGRSEKPEEVPLLEDHQEPPDRFEERAGHATHRCTDPAMVLVFLVAFGYWCYICNYARENGDIRRLYHGYNFTGGLCGVDDEANAFLYWCKPSSMELPGVVQGIDLAHPICIESCPTSTETSHNCYESHTTAPRVVLDSSGSYQETVTYNFKQEPDYPSKVFARGYCMPEEDGLRKMIMSKLEDSYAYRLLLEAREIENAWMPIMMAGVFAFICGILYLCVLHKVARCFVYVSLAVCVLLPMAAGVNLILVSFGEGFDGVPHTGVSWYNRLLGIALVLVGVIFAVIAFCAKRSIDIAIGCIQAGTECIFAMPSLLLEPVLACAMKVIIVVSMFWGFLHLMSCGEVHRASLASYVALNSLGEPKGIARSFTYEDGELYYMCYYLFMIFWASSFCSAMSQFVLAYSVQLWYFTPYAGSGKPDVPSQPLVRGFWVGCRYHLGTILFGSLLVAICEIFQVIFKFIAKQAKDDGNAILKVIASCLACCVGCIKKCVEFINKNAYMDVAINSTNFCPAAKHALQVIVSSAAAIAILNGATWIVTIAGVGSIVSGSVAMTYFMVTRVPMFSETDSDLYVQDPVLVCIIAGLLSTIVALTFMKVFGMASDTIIFCFAVDSKRREKGEGSGARYAPETLNNLISKYGDDTKEKRPTESAAD